MFKRLICAAALLTMSPGFATAESHASDAMTFEITGDAATGENVFRKCMACHQVGADAANRVGPVLNGVLGSTAGAREDFRYSNAMAAQGEEGLVWTPETLGAFLEKPRDYVKGTKMSFAGLRKEDERADVIAYLATFDN